MEPHEGISTEFWRFVRLAESHQLEYLVIGGMAMNFHGLLRNTIDTDIWLKPTRENLDRLCEIVLEMGYDADEFRFLREIQEIQNLVFMIEGPIDFLTTLHHRIHFDDCTVRKTVVQLEGIPIPVLGLEDLRESKILARRDQDLRDVLIIDKKLKNNNRNH
jgi:hypothetical protein